MATTNNKGFLDSIGYTNFNETAALSQRTKRMEVSGGGVGNAAYNRGIQTGAGAAPAAAGLAAGIGGLISGEGGRGIREFGRDFARGGKQAKDQAIAEEMGMAGGAQELRTRRETFKRIREAASQINDDGSVASRRELAGKVAEIAQQTGDFATLDKALRQMTELDREGEELRKLGLEGDAAEREAQLEKEVGFEARHMDDKEGTRGRAVRINKGPDTGKYMLYRPGQEPVVVEGGELQMPKTSAQASSSRLLVQDTLQGLARANGATPGKITQLRSQLTSMEQNARIVSNIATNLAGLQDPQAALDLSGKGAINADKSISFVESIADVFGFGGPEEDSRTNYDGQFMTTKKQREVAIERMQSEGLDRFAQANGMDSARDLLPQHVQDNALAAEQYWANIMELAYLDARLMEPSNRGLSDNDIQNALKRIGADTANPVSFAVRQLEVIETNLLPALENLGGNFSTFDNPSGYTSQQISNEVYGIENKLRVRDQLLATAEQLRGFIAAGRRGNQAPTAAPGPPGVGADLSDDALAQEIAALEAAASGN